ncbi:MAG TPA: ice-binding family protein [Xanthobacteraceae bacterium]|nr:ice-binding family protein [Xanthobacteraceae bacterium]
MQMSNQAAMAAAVILFATAMPAISRAAQPVDLGSAGNFVILSKAGISSTGSTAIVGNIGVSPIASTAITGFGLTRSANGRFATSSKVTGKVYAADFKAPTPSMLTTAVMDMQTAYNDAAGRKNPTATELGSGNIGGRTIRPGLYKWSSGVIIPTSVTLSGNENSVWIFQIAGTLNISSGKRIILTGGARAKNVFWQVAGKTTVGTTAVFNGNILGKTAIVFMTGAKFNGKALAQTAVTLDANPVTVRMDDEPTILLDSTFPCLGSCSALPEEP